MPLAQGRAPRVGDTVDVDRKLATLDGGVGTVIALCGRTGRYTVKYVAGGREGKLEPEALKLVVGAAAKTSSRRPFRSKKAPTRLKPEAPHANGFRRAAKRPNNVFEQPSAETSLAGASVAPTQQHRVLAKKRPRVAAADGGTRSAPAGPRAESCTRQWTARRELGVSLQDSAGVNSPVHRRSDRDSDDNFCVY